MVAGKIISRRSLFRPEILGYPPGQRHPDPERNELHSKLQPTRVEGVRAGHLGNRDFVIAMGTPIPCVLETAMASDQPGYVSCVVTRDILSDNGRVVLLFFAAEVFFPASAFIPFDLFEL